MSGKTRKGSTVENYIQEGLLALVPDYRDGECNTIVFSHLGEQRDRRSVNWLVKRLAAHFSLDLAELRRRCSKLLGLRHNISLPLDTNLVMLPVKMRQAESLGEVTIGFVNLLQVFSLIHLLLRKNMALKCTRITWKLGYDTVKRNPYGALSPPFAPAYIE